MQGKKSNFPSELTDTEVKRHLSFKQTLAIAWKNEPEFKKGVTIAAIGLIIVMAGSFIQSGNTTFIITVIGGLISCSGFDQISKAIVGMKESEKDDSKDN